MILTINCLFLLCQTHKQQCQSDVILDMMKSQQEELTNIAKVLKGDTTKEFPEIVDANGVLSYPTSSNGTVSGLALLVSM